MHLFFMLPLSFRWVKPNYLSLVACPFLPHTFQNFGWLALNSVLSGVVICIVFHNFERGSCDVIEES